MAHKGASVAQLQGFSRSHAVSALRRASGNGLGVRVLLSEPPDEGRAEVVPEEGRPHTG